MPKGILAGLILVFSILAAASDAVSMDIAAADSTTPAALRMPVEYKIDLPKDGPVISHRHIPVTTEEQQLEVLAHLVYAETLAAHQAKCSGANSKIRVGVAQVLFNRMGTYKAIKGGDNAAATQHIVFGADQFNSSLSGRYSRSQWKEFVKPTNLELFRQCYETVKKFSAGELNDPELKDVGNYFFHWHKGTYKKNPPWAKREDGLKPIHSGATQDCMVFYKLNDKAYIEKVMQ